MAPVPLAIAVGIATFYTVVTVRYCIQVCKWLPFNRRLNRRAGGLCPDCGYNLTANISGICPECGAKVGERLQGRHCASSPDVEHLPWWTWLIVAMMMFATFFWNELS